MYTILHRYLENMSSSIIAKKIKIMQLELDKNELENEWKKVEKYSFSIKQYKKEKTNTKQLETIFQKHNDSWKLIYTYIVH